MKRILFIASMFFVGISNLQAQVAHEKAKFFDNFYISPEIGATTNFHFNPTFPLNGAAGLKIGKSFSPILGLNIEGLAGFGNNGFCVDWPTKRYMNSKTFIKTLDLSINGTVNFTNIFSEYRPDRIFELGFEAGIGYAYLFGDQILTSYDNLGDNNETILKFGLPISWNLGEQKAFQIFLEPVILWNLTHGPGDAFHPSGAVAQTGLLLGLKYKFKNSNGTHNFKVYNINDMNNELNDMRTQLAAKPKEVVREVVKEVVKEVPTTSVQEVRVENLLFVTFQQGKSILTKEAKKALDVVESGKHVQVVGTASPEGSKEFNDKLSQARADVVADYLKSKGVIIDEATGKGVQGVTSNRLAVVYVK